MAQVKEVNNKRDFEREVFDSGYPTAVCFYPYDNDITMALKSENENYGRRLVMVKGKDSWIVDLGQEFKTDFRDNHAVICHFYKRSLINSIRGYLSKSQIGDFLARVR